MISWFPMPFGMWWVGDGNVNDDGDDDGTAAMKWSCLKYNDSIEGSDC